MLKCTEISEKFKFFEKKLQKFKYLEKIAKISIIWKELPKFQVFGKKCENLIILANVLLLLF